MNIQSIQKNDRGFTGLEAAIVLIAFIIVAAVFSFGILGTGFLTTQKSEDVVHSSTIQASSSLLTSGDVIVTGGVDKDSTPVDAPCATQITFYLTTAGGSSVDLDKTIITYTDDENLKAQEYVYDSTAANKKGPGPIPPVDWSKSNGWVYNGIIFNTNDNFLEQGEKYKVVVDLHTFIPSVASHPLPVGKEQVKLEIKPPQGAVLIIQVKMPDEIAKDTYYAVY